MLNRRIVACNRGTAFIFIKVMRIVVDIVVEDIPSLLGVASLLSTTHSTFMVAEKL